MASNGSVVDFVYGAGGHRVVQKVTSGAVTARTVYVGLDATGKSLYERTTSGSTIEHVQLIYAGGTHNGNAFALRVTTEGGTAGATSAMKYQHFDHLGSVTAVSEESGVVLDVASAGANAGVLGYAPWGARRNPDGGAASLPGRAAKGREVTVADGGGA